MTARGLTIGPGFSDGIVNEQGGHFDGPDTKFK